MKLTKYRLTKQINSTNKQTRKKYNKYEKKFGHSLTEKNKKPFNLKNKTLRVY